MALQHWTLTTLYLGFVAYCYVAYLLDPAHPLFLPYDVPPIQLPPFILVPHGIIRPPRRHPSSSQHTENLRPHLPEPSLIETNFSSPHSPPPRLPYSQRRCYHAAADISFNVSFSCCSVAACLHHVSRNLLPLMYTVAFAHALKICRRSTHSATVACLLLR